MGDNERSLKVELLLVKLAGGAAAQCIGLMNAIYLRNRNSKNFKIKYYPYSTGTYWPFAINFLLKESELDRETGLTKGLKETSDLEVGKVILDHPLSSKVFSYEKALSIVRKLRLERLLKKLLREHTIMANPRYLFGVKRRTRSVSGGFVPIFDTKVNSEMDLRFKSAKVLSPFSKSLKENKKNRIVIHYRIGDKRSKFSSSYHKDFGSDGIMDPQSFREILQKADFASHDRVLVLSDEPEVAKSLLKSVGIEAELNSKSGDLWNDLYQMSQADLFIGSWSQVSQLASICVAANGGKSYYPATTQVGTKVLWSIPDTILFEPKFLPDGHWIYDPEFDLDKNAHSIYLEP